MPAQQGARDPHDLAGQRLRRMGRRYTAGQRAVVDVLEAAGHPVSISDIAVILPWLPRSSAYRHLAGLHAAGVVSRVAADGEFTRFELAEDLTGHHHHLHCLECGMVIDVTLPAGAEQDLAAAVGRAAGGEGFRARCHRLDITGACAACTSDDPVPAP